MDCEATKPHRKALEPALKWVLAIEFQRKISPILVARNFEISRSNFTRQNSIDA